MKQRDIFSHTSLIFQLVLWFVDIISISLSCIFCYWLVFGSFTMVLHYNVALLLSCMLLSGLFVLARLYDLNTQRYGYPVLMKIAGVLAIGFVSVVITAVFLKVTTDFSRFWLGSWFFLSLVAIYIGRVLSSAIIYLINGGWLPQRTTIIIGDKTSVLKTYSRLKLWRYSNMDVKGCFYDEVDSEKNDSDSDMDSVGVVEDAFSYIDTNTVDQVWVAFDIARYQDTQLTLERLNESLPDVKLVPYVSDMYLVNHSLEVVAGMPVLNLSVSPFHGLNKILKLIEDKLISAVLLVLLAPLFLVIACMVKASSPGSVIYSQKRISWNGKEFKIYKFRSMPVGSENETGAVWAKNNEPRATRIGHFLRKTSMDELPQFFNVLKGDMAIVGPRPERPIFVDEFKDQIPGYMLKHKVKAGITGWAQVNGFRGDTDLTQRIEHDLYYIENWSLIFDLKIIVNTAWQMVGKK